MDKLYTHGTQDIVFSSLVSLGFISTIKAQKLKIKLNINLRTWIGLAVMMKTYLTVIPLLDFSYSCKIKINF